MGEGEGEGKKSEIYMFFNQGLIIFFFFFCQKCFRDLLGKNTENKILNFKVI